MKGQCSFNLLKWSGGCERSYQQSNTYIPLISPVFGPYCKLRTEFFSTDLWPKRENRWKKQGSIIYSTDQKNEANKMFITRLLPIWGTGNKCRTRDLTGIWQASRKKFLLAINENNSSQQSVSEKVKTNSPCWKKVYSVKTSGGERQGRGPRNDVLTTCKAVTLRGGQRVIDAFPTLNILIS